LAASSALGSLGLVWQQNKLESSGGRPDPKSSWNIGLFQGEPSYYFMADDWVEKRDKAVLNTVYYCETCNMIIEPGDADISIHKRELAHHKMRRVMILRCGRCENIVTDSYAEYSPEKNQFWCKNCISETGAKTFHSA
jgi:hypothetical protein